MKFVLQFCSYQKQFSLQLYRFVRKRRRSWSNFLLKLLEELLIQGTATIKSLFKCCISMNFISVNEWIQLMNFQWISFPKLKKIEGGKILTPPTPQNVTSSFLRSVKNLFRNILIFLLLIERSHWVEEKIIKNYDLKIFCSGNISPQKMYKILASNLWTTVRNLYI